MSLEGDKLAYEEFLIKLQKALSSYVRKKSYAYKKTKQEQDEIVQEVLIKIHSKRHTYQRHLKISPWIYTIARNTLVDHLRGLNNQVRHDEFNEEVLTLVHEEGSSEQEYNFLIHDELKHLLARLPRKQRDILVLAKSYGYSNAEIAKTKGLSVSAVKISIFRAIKSVSKNVEGINDK